MNARDLRNDIPPVDGSTNETPVLPDVWKHDFTCVPPAARRAARYVLQLLGLERKFMDEDNLDQVDMAWKIVFPLIDQAAESRAFDSLPHTEEHLQHMENFPGIFIAATNLMTGIDPAALRRFDFKLAFQTMALPQRVAMFAREAMGDIEAGTSLPAPFVNRLAQLESLTPGDFANVCRQREILAEDLAPEEFLRRLVQECRWKAAA